MSELIAIAEKLLADATREQDRLAEQVRVVAETLTKRRAKLEAAQRRVREINADLAALKRTNAPFKIVGNEP